MKSPHFRIQSSKQQLGVLMRQGLPKRVGSLEEMERLVRAWELDRNRRCASVDWRFTAGDARVKLKRLYPKFND